MQEERLLRLPQVRERTGLGRSSIYSRIAANEFPRPIKAGRTRQVAWAESRGEEPGSSNRSGGAGGDGATELAR